MADPKHFKLSCPLPELDFDIITLGHGSGGLLTNRLLDELVFSLFHNPQIDKQHDGAVMDLTGKTAFSTDSFVVDPIFFPGGDIGDLAVNGTVNDVAMCGGLPRFISLGLIIEEGLSVAQLWEILNTIKNAADKASVQIVTGDTKVVDRGKADKIFINTSGLGTIKSDVELSVGNIRPGDVIVCSGSIANHGMAIMSVREGLEFDSEIKSDTRSIHRPALQMVEQLGKDLHFMRDPTRGGIATVLNEIARQGNLGIEINEAALPVEEQVSAACEMLGLDPIYVANEGIFISIVQKEQATAAVEILKSFPESSDPAVIGFVTEQNPGKVVIQSEIGGKRVVNMLTGSQLPRIC
jgi:hydrogenase expression/formation protein HypE